MKKTKQNLSKLGLLLLLPVFSGCAGLQGGGLLKPTPIASEPALNDMDRELLETAKSVKQSMAKLAAVKSPEQLADERAVAEAKAAQEKAAAVAKELARVAAEKASTEMPSLVPDSAAQPKGFSDSNREVVIAAKVEAPVAVKPAAVPANNYEDYLPRSKASDTPVAEVAVKQEPTVDAANVTAVRATKKTNRNTTLANTPAATGSQGNNAAVRATAPTGLNARANLTWEGPLDELLATMVKGLPGYSLDVQGDTPSLPILVTVNARKVALIDIFKDLGAQAGKRATVKVNADKRLVTLIYNVKAKPVHAITGKTLDELKAERDEAARLAALNRKRSVIEVIADLFKPTAETKGN